MNPKLELPKPKETVDLNCEIEKELHAKVKKAAKKRGLKLKDAVEFGLKCFLAEVEK